MRTALSNECAKRKAKPRIKSGATERGCLVLPFTARYRSGHYNVVDTTDMLLARRMKFALALSLVASTLLTACHAKEGNRGLCTAQTVGRETGYDTVRVTLLIPETYHPRHPNGGIFAVGQKCDFALNAFFAEDTAYRLIAAAKDFPLKHEPSQSFVADAELKIWKFKDGSGEVNFFVTNVSKTAALTKPPAFTDSKYFSLKQNVR